MWPQAVPVHVVLPLQHLGDLLPARLLVLWVAGQTEEEPRDAAGGSVVALEHERVNLRSDVLVSKSLLVVILPTVDDTSERIRS